jgi:hypothetical protein
MSARHSSCRRIGDRFALTLSQPAPGLDGGNEIELARVVERDADLDPR